MRTTYETTSHARSGLLGALLSAFVVSLLPACTGIQPCSKPGITESCECKRGVGVRACLPERVWDECDCSALAMMDAAGTGGMPASGAGGMSGGGAGQAAAGSGGMSGGGSGSGGAAGTMMMDPDAGPSMMAGSDGGAAGSMPDAGGMAGTGGAGSGGTTAPPPDAYRTCAEATDCDQDGECLSAPDPENAAEELHVCSPPCLDLTECPLPAGSFEATRVCNDGRCGLDCSPAELLGENLSCPGSMVCVSTDVLGPSLCFAAP